MAETQVKGQNVGDRSITHLDIDLSTAPQKSPASGSIYLAIVDPGDSLTKIIAVSVLETYFNSKYALQGHTHSGYEPALGNPSANGYVLSSTTAGVRSWVPVSAGSGTVTSVGLVMPDIFNISGSPVTTSGTLRAQFNTQNERLFLAGDILGNGWSVPTFRAIVASDLPVLPYDNYVSWKLTTSAGTSQINSVNSTGTYRGVEFVAGTNVTISTASNASQQIQLTISAAGGSGSGTVTSVTAGNGLTQSGTASINPTLDVVSHAGSSGTIGTLTVTADSVGVTLGTTGTTAAAGNHTHLYAPYYTSLSSNATTTSTTAVDVAGLVVAVLSGGVYEYEAELQVLSDISTTGMSFGVYLSGTGSGSGNVLGYTTSATTITLTTVNVGTMVGPYYAFSSGNGGLIIRGIVRPTANCNLSVKYLKNTSGTATVKSNSFFKVTRIS